ncbi:leucyl-tRNA synthetase [Cruoricaptor ignavus]|uniref:Leucine--tRNA ligase n=1 Tax=Cruoricaptor ignavus TaxID=1118202 RepID=A0A1M6A6D6_9FLAO|nr:leucine--tRNA ligase [Cruoricaptor ignavus]SHI31967.1 leucyl-tRNA synthetase [Cruoricaptor ignavus]
MFYDHQAIERKWQKIWNERQTFRAAEPNETEKPKFYALDMFPYPSGAGLHVGHPLGYIASDIYARFKRHQGYNVLHPIGYDSFGLPAEQYAIQTGQHPAITTEENAARYEEQLRRIGFSFDWSRELKTSDPAYYKWTQWIFVQLFHSWYDFETDKAEPISTLVNHFQKFGTENLNAAQTDALNFSAEEWNNASEADQQDILLNYRLAYRAETTVNWCPALGTVLANDEVKDGKSERGGHSVFQKKMMQWSMRISAYSERLLNGLENLDWPQPLKDSQEYWIGKSVGASIKFEIQNSKFEVSQNEKSTVEIFTTRPDTIFGATFMVLAPEHPLVEELTTDDQKAEVENYTEETSKKSERERMADVKNVSGAFTGSYAVHPFTGKALPIFISDYVLMGYGTGAVMAVPAHDERDHRFAKKFGLEIINVIEHDGDVQEESYDSKDSVCVNSEFLNGLNYNDAKIKILEKIEALGIGKGMTNYRQRDAIFSRQRYWGEPVPVYFKDGLPYTLPESALPLELPEVEKYLPTEDGEPPLGNAKNWAWDEANEKVVESQLIDNEKVFPIELSTMPGWAGSSWYFLRYMDPRNDGYFCQKEKSDYWGQVDLYIGGSEHATGHLLYSRFWNMFLKDRGFIAQEEPFQKLINQGMILGMSAFVFRIEGTNKFVSKNLAKDYQTQKIHADVSLLKGATDELDVELFRNWRPEFADAEFILDDEKYLVEREVEKMSKSKYNVVNPDDICDEYGADCLRLYEMFLGPLEQSKPWNTQGLSGVYGFLKKFYNLYYNGDEFSVSDEAPTKAELKVLHTLIKRFTYDIEHFSFNTSVSQFMIAVNELQKLKCNKRQILEPLAVLISPYAPHICEELWEKLGHETSVDFAAFPELNEAFLVEDEFEYPVSFNGKMRFKLALPTGMEPQDVEKAALADERVLAQLAGNTPKKVIVVKDKIVNIVH